MLSCPDLIQKQVFSVLFSFSQVFNLVIIDTKKLLLHPIFVALHNSILVFNYICQWHIRIWDQPRLPLTVQTAHGGTGGSVSGSEHEAFSTRGILQHI